MDTLLLKILILYNNRNKDSLWLKEKQLKELWLMGIRAQGVAHKQNLQFFL